MHTLLLKCFLQRMKTKNTNRKTSSSFVINTTNYESEHTTDKQNNVMLVTVAVAKTKGLVSFGKLKLL